jgi:RNase P/RNase MRP subunit p29
MKENGIVVSQFNPLYWERRLEMNHVYRKLFFVVVVLMVTTLFFSTRATAIIIDDYNPKLNGVQGVVTKIEGNKLTLRDDAGKLIILKVRDLATYKETPFKIGDKVKIQNGELIKLSDLQRQPLQPAGGAAVVTYTKGQGSPVQGK